MAGMTVAERLGLDKGHHDLKIGKSFEKSSKDSFHTIRCKLMLNRTGTWLRTSHLRAILWASLPSLNPSNVFL